VTPYAIPVSIVGMLSSEISISLRLRGVSHVLSCGCTSSTDAISYAASLIRAGDAEVLLSGGTDACVTPGMIFGFSRMKVVSMAHNDTPAAASRPFDRRRDEFVLGEGAWMIVLEREDRARARGAAIYASVDGYGSTCDAYHRVQMAPDGVEIVRAITLAIERSGRRREGSATSTITDLDDPERCGRVAVRPAGVRRPCRSARRVLGQVDDRSPAGASGAAGGVTAALAMSRQLPLPPTINLTIPIRRATWISSPIRRAPPTSKRLCNCLGFDQRIARW
jgi:3-oxoacyl-[acyl-carrier-protein] synthase II